MTVRQFEMPYPTKLSGGIYVDDWHYQMSWSDAYNCPIGAVGLIPIAGGGASWWTTLGSVGWNRYNYEWEISRLALTFPTQSIPVGVTIKSGRLYLRTNLQVWNLPPDPSGQYWHFVQGNHNTPPVGTDFGAMKSQNVSGGLAYDLVDNTGALHTAYQNLNATGLTWITPGGYTRLGVRCKADIDNNGQPNIISAIQMAGVTPTKQPVTTLDATDVDASAMLHASVGQREPPFLEVEYEGGVETDPIYPRFRFYWSASGGIWGRTPWQYSYVAGQQYSYKLTGLQPDTTYFFRAESETLEGGTYWATGKFFTTSPRPSRLFGNVLIDQRIYQHCERMSR